MTQRYLAPDARAKLVDANGAPTADAHRYLSGISVLSEILQYFTIGTGTPEAVVTASVPHFFIRLDGGAGTTLYAKESGTGNTGWVGK
jgi:hypothetical protein